MATKTKKDGQKKNLVGQLSDEVAERSRDIWLAGLGAFATVEEEGNKLFNTLVTRGKEREEKGKEQIDEVYKKLEERQKKVTSGVDDMLEKVEGRVEDVLTKFGVPKRKEVKELTDKVDALSERVSKLVEQMEKESDSKSKKSKSKSKSTKKS
ncbi:MAG: phasin family protein [Bacteroidota bacterium]